MTTYNDPEELLALFVEALRGIPEVVALVDGDTDNIVAYTEDLNGDLLQSIADLAGPKVLVFLDGIVGAGRFPYSLTVSFELAIRAKNPTAFYPAIAGGVSTWSGSDGQSMTSSTIHPRFDPMAIPHLVRRVIPVGEAAAFNYYAIVTSFTQKDSN